MLQRAASNAYSWWWASHIRTKQSKWLEQNLQDMDEKVKYMLQIIDDDGDSFAKRAEMYYRKRPELINFVEESYRAYRALAERYDHISRELQNANRTIATVFPEQVQLTMDDDEENFPETSTPSHHTNKPSKVLPAVPKTSFPKLPKLTRNYAAKSLSRKGQLRKAITAATAITSLGLSKTEALEEIDKLQKGILALQTEKEFIKSSYEGGLAKYWEIEKQITEMQGKVCSLQDEFGIGTVIEDDEARTLMAATALKSCQDSLVQLQEKQEQSAEEARVEYQKIKAAHEKLKTLKDEFLGQGSDQQEQSKDHKSLHIIPELENLDQQVSRMEQERHDLELLRQKIKEEFKLDSTSLNMTKLVEKIDELVNKVISLETAVSSQTALVKTLRSETDELQAQIQSLEEDKETLIEGSDSMSNKLRELEEELHRVKELNQSVQDRNHNLQTHFTEATCNLDNLSEKLQIVKPDEELENRALFREAGALTPEKEFSRHEDVLAPGNGSVISNEVILHKEKKNNASELSSSVKIEEENIVQSNPSSNLDVVSGICQEREQKVRDERQDFSQTVFNDLVIEAQELGMLEDQPNWKQLLSSGIDDREKFLLEEYTAILRSYREVKRKLSDVEKKNRDSLFELAMQIKELKNANVLKDEEIQSLCQKLSTPQTKPDENLDMSLTEFHSELKWPQGSISKGARFQVSNSSSLTANQQPVFNFLNEPVVESSEGIEESSSTGNTKISPTKDKENEVQVICVKDHDVPTIEEKFRTDIDSLLEENLEFWLRFSTSVNQVQKFRTSIQDLQADLSKLKHDGSFKHQSMKSDARPIYKHLREIQTELTLWLEQNSLLKDELQSRLSSLCSIQEEISRMSNAGAKVEEAELNKYQAAKFQGEVLNMKQENNKVRDELQSGIDHVRGLQVEIEKTLSKLDEDLGISASNNHPYHTKNSLQRTRVPLRSFLFGVKLKKQKPSIFSCMNPALQKQYSDLTSGLPS